MGEVSQIVITFIVAEKANSQFLLLYLRYIWGLVENVGGGGLKLLKKSHMFERSRSAGSYALKL